LNGGTCVDLFDGTFVCVCAVTCPCVDMGDLCEKGKNQYRFLETMLDDKFPFKKVTCNMHQHGARYRLLSTIIHLVWLDATG
jgi:hypothetical protein